jgi:plastocyanin
MLDMPASFQPAVITIEVGDAVKWENVSNSVHHATNDPSDAINAADVTNPPGAKPFDSHFIQPGESFTHTFTVPGTYKYVCAAHEMSGMTAEVVVK